MPIGATLVLFMACKVWNLPAWSYGVAGTLCVIFWSVWIIDKIDYNDKHVDVFEELDKKHDQETMKKIIKEAKDDILFPGNRMK